MDSSDVEVFKSICDLMTRADFKEAQTEFFRSNCNKFDVPKAEGEAQFKLEYKQIHEDYLGLNERLIETKLITEYNYGGDDLESFYSTFKENFKTYE